MILIVTIYYLKDIYIILKLSDIIYDKGKFNENLIRYPINDEKQINRNMRNNFLLFSIYFNILVNYILYQFHQS